MHDDKPHHFIHFVEHIGQRGDSIVLHVRIPMHMHVVTARHCEHFGWHTMRFYRDVFAAGLREALIRSGSRSGALEHALPERSASPEAARPLQATRRTGLGTTQLSTDWAAIEKDRADAEAYRNRK